MSEQKRYNLRNDREMTKKDAKFLENRAEMNRKKALSRGDVATGKRAGMPSIQRIYFAEKLQDAIDKIENGSVKISGPVSKTQVLKRLKDRKAKTLSMNT